MRGTSAVVGIGESRFYRPGGSPDTEFQQCCEAIEKAANDAGVPLAQASYQVWDTEKWFASS